MIKQDRKSVIPMEVYDSHGSITGNVVNVLSKWKDDFASLFKDKDGFGLNMSFSQCESESARV